MVNFSALYLSRKKVQFFQLSHNAFLSLKPRSSPSFHLLCACVWRNLATICWASASFCWMEIKLKCDCWNIYCFSCCVYFNLRIFEKKTVKNLVFHMKYDTAITNTFKKAIGNYRKLFQVFGVFRWSFIAFVRFLCYELLLCICLDLPGFTVWSVVCGD